MGGVKPKGRWAAEHVLGGVKPKCRGAAEHVLGGVKPKGRGAAKHVLGGVKPKGRGAAVAALKSCRVDCCLVDGGYFLCTFPGVEVEEVLGLFLQGSCEGKKRPSH